MNNKGLSVMIGYVLLISIVIVMSGLVYQWMKTYVPVETVECPDGVSMFIKDISCDASNKLTLTLKNSGRFNIDGYFIRGAESEGELATISLAEFLNLIESSGAQLADNAVMFNSPLTSGNEITHVFDGIPTFYSIEITPIKVQGDDFLSCGNAKIKEVLICG